MVDGFVLSFTFFYLFLFVLFMFLWGREKEDLMLKTIFFLLAVTTLIFMVPNAFYANDYHKDFSSVETYIVLDEIDVFNYNLLPTYDVLTASDQYIVYNFENIDNEDTQLYSNSKICFYYNNTDASNVVSFTNGVDRISEYIYLSNNTEGEVCAEINSTYLKQSSLLGVICEDCTIPNNLRIPYVDTPTKVKEIYIDRNNPFIYEIELATPHLFYIETHQLPYFSIKNNFVLYLEVMVFFVLSLLLYLLIRVIVLAKKVMEGSYK